MHTAFVQRAWEDVNEKEGLESRVAKRCCRDAELIVYEVSPRWAVFARSRTGGHDFDYYRLQLMYRW